jgi:glutamate/aspartate transport system ATP-binding protein
VRARILLDRVGLNDKETAYPVNLSGGRQQRIAIARALAIEGMTMMAVTHEMGFARRVASRVVFMDQGAGVEDCSTNDFFNHSESRSDRAQLFLNKILSH